MKDEVHPDNYRDVIFHDTTSGERFLFKSTVETEETAEWEGVEYPLARVEMSSASHPFYTGVEKVVDTAGRVEKFKARFQKAQDKQEEQQESQSEDSGVETSDGESKSRSSESGEDSGNTEN